MSYIRSSVFAIFYISCIFCLSACSQNVEKDPYNLQFDPNKHSWQPGSATTYRAISMDSIQVIDGKHPFLIRRNLQSIGWNAASLSQRIILPHPVSDTVRISVHNSCRYLTQALLYICRYNEREELISRDSININKEGWNKHSITLPARNTRILQLEIFVQALGQTVPKQELWNQPGFMQFLALDKIEIKIGTKDIAEFSTMQEREMTHRAKLRAEKAVPLSNITTQALPMLKGKKIVALGETTHFNKAVKETVFDIIKSQILHNNCRLVMYEMPYDEGCMYNYYVSGCKVPPVFTQIMEGTISPELSASFVGFLQWLRNYNKDKKQKVMFLGIDDSRSSTFPVELDILDAAVASPPERVALADLFDYLARSKYIQAESELIKQREMLVKLLGLQNYELLSYDIHLSALNNDQSFYANGKYFGSSDYRFLRRDSTMFQITKKYLSMLLADETAYIYSHFLHLSRNTTVHPWRPLGYYLNKEYGSDYFPLALLVGSGTNTMFHQLSNKSEKVRHFNYTLTLPPENSLENAAGKISDKIFYYPLDTTNYSLNYIRTVGSNLLQGNTEKQFDVISPKANIDGFIYIPVGTAYTGLPSESAIVENHLRMHELKYKRMLSFKKDNTYRYEKSKK